MQQESKSYESELLNPRDDTTDDADQFENNKYRYYCRYMKNGCKATLYLRLDEGSKGLCFVSDVYHTDHPEQLESKEKINPTVRQRIVELEAFGHKQDGIFRQLFKDGLEPPQKTKIQNLLKEIRKTKKVTNSQTLNDLKKWCEQFYQIPDDENEVFVGNYELDAIKGKKLESF
ncbi:unnamed protein product [Brachionus calyciflorus]|uniref:Uncharacterized protein n=1 Tax=Brachionus calyciflorus TaxID=104777 RepID=A0A814J8H3_9BILA|nr:unnamed protein product [Brachionus calyciflorus]